MAYAHKNSKGTIYFLHRTMTKLKNGREQAIYYFGKTADDTHALDAVPAGYTVSEASSGLLVLKKQAPS